MRIILIALLTGMLLLACSQGTGSNTPDDAVPAETLATDRSHSSRVFPRGETSLEERIANYPTVVRARMTSESTEVVAGAGRFEGNYYAALKFDLEVGEYLNGTGADNITAIWVAADEFGTRQEAEDALPDIRARRDTQWDNREAVFFLQELRDAQAFPLDVLPTLQGDNHYYLSFGISQPHRDGYSLSSEYSKLWLPATEIASGATGQSGTVGDGQEFLLDMPTAPVGATGASGASTPAGPTITLGDLKQRLAAVTAELNASDGSEEYKECVRFKYQNEREDRYFIAEGEGRRVYVTHPTHEFDSGQPAGTTIYEDEVVSAESTEKRSRLWFDGRDSALFDVVTGDLVPGAYVSTITQTVVSARPIPAGEYKVNNNYLLLPFIPCNHVFTYGMTMTVTAPEGTVHEAFFDPVVIGAAVGADGSRGVLKPASFAIEGVGTTDIKRIRWESARVEMQIDPPGRPTGHHIDFIALDGTVVLRLDFDDAVDVVEEGRTRALTWGVCERSWNDGDLLMLRISESPPGLTGTTNDVLCPPPPPQNLTATEVVRPLPTLKSPPIVSSSTLRARFVEDDFSPGPDIYYAASLFRSQGGGIPVQVTDAAGNVLGQEVGRNRLVVEFNVSQIPLDQRSGDFSVRVVMCPRDAGSDHTLDYCGSYGPEGATTVLPLLVPPPPQGLVATGDTGGRARLEWTLVPNASTYKFQYRESSTDNGNGWTDVTGTAPTSPTYVRNLGCRTYDFRVSAQGDGTSYNTGWSDWSEATSTTVTTCTTGSRSTRDTGQSIGVPTVVEESQ